MVDGYMGFGSKAWAGYATIVNPAAGSVATALTAGGASDKVRAKGFRVLTASTYTVTQGGGYTDGGAQAYLSGEGYIVPITDIVGTGTVKVFW